MEQTDVKETKVEKELERPSGRNFMDIPELRDSIEAKLAPLSIQELFDKGRLTQVIPIREGMTIKLSTVESGVDSMIDRLVFAATKDGEIYNRVMIKYQLAAALIEYDGRPVLPGEFEYQPSKEKEYQEQLIKKLDIINQMSSHHTMLLTTHLLWFDERVIAFYKKEFFPQLKNF